MRHCDWYLVATSALALGLSAQGAAAQSAPADCAGKMRSVNIGVSVVPPNVVHTSPHVAKELGFFAKRCIDANIIHFEGGSSATSTAAVAQGKAIANVTDTMVGAGMKAHQVWGFAPRLPQSYVVTAEVKSPADLKGRRLSAAGGGVGSFNWRMGRAMLADAKLTVDDAQFVSQGLAGRLPGLVAGQLDGVSLHPEDVYLAQKQKPGAHVLSVLADKMPNYVFNAYGASDDYIANNRDLLVDTIAAMIEANRAMYTDKAKVLPIITKATDKPQDAVEFAIDQLTKNCVWSVNTGFDRSRAEWTIQNSVEAGDIEPGKKPTYEQLVNESIAKEAVQKAGGPKEINGCKG
jgi:NitT/TauT family transport system substrate-binding protein